MKERVQKVISFDVGSEGHAFIERAARIAGVAAGAFSRKAAFAAAAALLGEVAPVVRQDVYQMLRTATPEQRDAIAKILEGGRCSRSPGGCDEHSQ